MKTHAPTSPWSAGVPVAALLLGIFSALTSATAGVIPASRIFPEAWQSAGNPGNPPPQNRTVDVRDFNAAGDGLSDDRPALLAALASLGGEPGVVYFPPGEYLLQAAVNIPPALSFGGTVPHKRRCASTSSHLRSTLPEGQPAAVFPLPPQHPCAPTVSPWPIHPVSPRAITPC